MFEESASNPSIWASMNSWFSPTVLFVLLNLVIGTILFSSSLSNQPQQEKQEQESNHQNDPQQPQPQHQPKLGRSPSVLQRLKSINLYNYRSQESSPPIASLFKQTLDSNPQYPSQQPHQEQFIETHTSYFFEEPHHHETITTETQFISDQNFEQIAPKSRTHLIFEQTHEENTQKSQPHLVSEQIHEENYQQAVTHYGSEEIHGDEEGEEEDSVPQSLDEVYSKLAQMANHQVKRTTSDTKPASGEVPAKLPQKIRKSASLKSPFGHFEESDIVEARRPATVRERKAKVTEPDDEVDAKADDFINKFKQQLKLQRKDSILRYKEVISRGSAQ